MKHLKKLAVAATIALAGLTSAQAFEIAGSDTPITQVNTYSLNNQWTFSDSGLQLQDPSTDYFTEGPLNRTAGQTFVDVFIINVPDSETITFTFSSTGIDFSEFAIAPAYGTGTLIDDVAYADGTTSVTTSGYSLTSGTYEFDIYGTFTTSGAGFSGSVFGLAPVPEPTNLGLLLAGLGAIGALARRRKTQA